MLHMFSFCVSISSGFGDLCLCMGWQPHQIALCFILYFRYKKTVGFTRLLLGFVLLKQCHTEQL